MCCKLSLLCLSLVCCLLVTLLDYRELPWAERQPLAFRKFLRFFFTADPSKRPHAHCLSWGAALKNAP